MLRSSGRLLLCGLAACVMFFGSSTAQAQQMSGVLVDATGVLRMNVVDDPGGRLLRQRLASAAQALPADLASTSPMRKVSLNRLEQMIDAQLNSGSVLTEDMRYLAGLTRIEYVFLYPETGDVVIAGPAEGWGTDLIGRVRGLKSGRPTLQLEDLAVAMRAYRPGSHDRPLVGCSIDPTQQGLAAMQNFLRNLVPTPNDGPRIAAGLKHHLGLQTVSVTGISPQTNMARVLVEADYRMKLIGIGLEELPVKIRSYVDVARPSQVSQNAMCRWFFVPDYQCVRVSEDNLAMQLEGQGVKLIGEDEVVNADGSRRVNAGSTSRASKVFTGSFTKKYEEIAAKVPIYAQMRASIDLLVAAAFIQQQDYYGQSGWMAETLLDEEKIKTELYPAPKQVETAVNVIWKGNTLMTPVGGGVTIHADRALASASLLEDEQNKVQDQRKQVQLNHLKEGQWWWD